MGEKDGFFYSKIVKAFGLKKSKNYFESELIVFAAARKEENRVFFWKSNWKKISDN